MAQTRATPAADPAYNPANPATRKTTIDNPPDGKLMVTYHPGLGDPRTVEAFGRRFKAGEAIEVEPEFRNKIWGNPYFSIKGEDTYGDENRQRGAAEVEDEEDNLTFDENVLANRMEEYGTSDPKAAEQLRRSGETSFTRSLAPRPRNRPEKEQLRTEARTRAEEHAAELAAIKNEQADEANEKAKLQAKINAARAEQERK